MSSKTEIANLALGFVGAKRIISLDDNNSRANSCNDMYPLARDASLEAREWSFASKRVVLAQDGVAPEYGYGYKFAIPSDNLRVLKVDSDPDFRREIDWTLADGFILCNHDTIYIKYIYRANESTFTAMFSQAVAYKLAADICIPLTKNVALMPQMMNTWDNMIGEAASLDGMQGKREILKANRLVGSRSMGFIGGGNFNA